VVLCWILVGGQVLPAGQWHKTPSTICELLPPPEKRRGAKPSFTSSRSAACSASSPSPARARRRRSASSPSTRKKSTSRIALTSPPSLLPSGASGRGGEVRGKRLEGRYLTEGCAFWAGAFCVRHQTAITQASESVSEV